MSVLSVAGVDMSLAARRAELVEEIGDLRTSFEAFKLLKRLASDLGYDKFTVLGLPELDEQLGAKVVVNNWDPEMAAAYDEHGLAGDSPVLERIRTSLMPFTFNVEEVNRHRAKKQKDIVIDLFNSFGMADGIYIPVHQPGGVTSAVGFTGQGVDITEEDVSALQLIAMAACDRLRAITQHDAKAPVDLTERERDCLCWTAAGKTSAEIGAILSLSEHTVNHCITAATRKLDAVSRSQAVAKALRLGLIS
ncbi:MAG: autoinducer binding domain-containing protein [Pseudomonadota bacterium]